MWMLQEMARLPHFAQRPNRDLKSFMKREIFVFR